MIINDSVNVFIGLALSFAAISLIVSAAVEGIASVLSWRSHTLLAGLQLLLNDKALTGLTLDVLNHALANPLGPGDATGPPPSPWQSLLRKLPYVGKQQPVPAAAGAAANVVQPLQPPSYIAPEQFAAALIDVIAKPKQVQEAQSDLRAAIVQCVRDPQLQPMLLGMYDRAGKDVALFQKRIAAWFDASMDRLSGVYKRRTQWWSFWIALGLAALLNVDAIGLAKQLWVDPAISGNAAGIKTTPDYQSAFAVWASSFPFGWALPKASPWAWPIMAFGWFLTACATIFGAPFWFDTLQRFVQLRGTGTAPDEKRGAG